MTTSRLELAEQLLDSLLTQLVTRLAAPARPSTDLLVVVRGYLRDQGFFGGPAAVADQARLQALWGLYLVRLEEAIKAERPPSALFAEVRRFLDGQGVSKDLGAALSEEDALKALGSASLPFVETGH